MHYDLVDLRLFVLIIESGGFAAAARKANMSVSALSERIKRLEERTGMSLLQRTARGAVPTRVGREIAAQARAVLLQAERLNGVVAAWKHQERGAIRLLANSNALTSFLPDVLAAFLARHPEVIVDLRESTSDRIAHAIRQGQADLGIAAGNAKLDDLELRPFRRDRLVAALPAGHRLSGRLAVDFAELLDEPFIGLDEASAIHAFLMEQGRRLGHEITVRIRLRSFDGVCRMVAAGAGIAIVPATAVGRQVLEAGVEAVPLSDSWAERELVICLPRNRPVSPLARLLANQISQAVPVGIEERARRPVAAKRRAEDRL